VKPFAVSIETIYYRITTSLVIVNLGGQIESTDMLISPIYWKMIDYFITRDKKISIPIKTNTK